MTAPFKSGAEALPLTPDEVRDELRKFGAGTLTALATRGDRLVADLLMDGDDLLQLAICRAISGRSCPAEVNAEVYVRGIMRSIASTKRRARERREEREVELENGEVADWLTVGSAIMLPPDQAIEHQRRQQKAEHALKTVCRRSDLQAQLVDAIGMGLRGERLADHLGLSTKQLATARRALKRDVQRIWQG